ncbi:hypothetical protein Droror1_Dr00017345 [Drosera rotundifolia]
MIMLSTHKHTGRWVTFFHIGHLLSTIAKAAQQGASPAQPNKDSSPARLHKTLSPAAHYNSSSARRLPDISSSPANATWQDSSPAKEDANREGRRTGGCRRREERRCTVLVAGDGSVLVAGDRDVEARGVGSRRWVSVGGRRQG